MSASSPRTAEILTHDNGMPNLQKQVSTHTRIDSIPLKPKNISNLPPERTHIKETLTRCEIILLPLESSQMPKQRRQEHQQTNTRSPPSHYVPYQIIFDARVTPSIHSHPVPEEWPLKGSRGDCIFLVGVRDESVVGGHHCYVQMPKVAEERRAVKFLVSSRYCRENIDVSVIKLPLAQISSRRSFQ